MYLRRGYRIGKSTRKRLKGGTERGIRPILEPKLDTQRDGAGGALRCCFFVRKFAKELGLRGEERDAEVAIVCIVSPPSPCTTTPGGAGGLRLRGGGGGGLLLLIRVREIAAGAVG